MKKSPIYLLAALIVVAFVGCGPKAEPPQADQAAAAAAAVQAPEKIGPFGILHRGVTTDIPEPAQLSADEAKRKEIAERLDKEKLLASFKVVEDKSETMLQAPKNIARFVGRDFVMAKEPPAVEFAVVPAKPLFFAEPPAGNHVGPWSNWSQAVFHAKTGKFYSSVGDHGAYDAHTYIVEYDPASKTVRCLPEINHVLGRTAAVFGEGKIHGWLDFYPQGSSNLWFCTYWCKYPEPEEQDYRHGLRRRPHHEPQRRDGRHRRLRRAHQKSLLSLPSRRHPTRHHVCRGHVRRVPGLGHQRPENSLGRLPARGPDLVEPGHHDR